MGCPTRAQRVDPAESAVTEAAADADSQSVARSPSGRIRRISVLLILVVAGLVPWTGYLAYTLPTRYDAHHWNVLWAGFDLALMVVLAYTAWAAWFRRQIMMATALVAGTLLLCDAWFDVVSAFGTSDMTITLITAIGGELPLGVLCFWLARRIMLRSVEAFHQAAGGPGRVPRLRDAAILLAPTRLPAPQGDQGRDGSSRPDRPPGASGRGASGGPAPGHGASKNET